MGQFLDLGDEGLHQIIRGVRAAVGKVSLEMSPNPFVRVEFGSVARKGFQMEPRKPMGQVTDRLSLVNAGIVQKHDDVAVQVSKQMMQEFADFGVPDILFMKMTIQPQVFPFRADRNTRNRRDFVVPVAVTMNGSPASGCPGFAQVWDQQESGFVNKDKVGAQPCGVFFIRGHSSVFQRLISFSSRSKARLSGFWWVHPSSRINRPIWSRWYRTPKFASMRSAIRCVVHKSVRYPWARGPFRRDRTKQSFCRVLSLGGRPGTAFGFSAASPPSATASRHRITLLGLHPILRATSFKERPSSNSRIARRRRSSKAPGEPLGRIGSILSLGYSSSNRPMNRVLVWGLEI